MKTVKIDREIWSRGNLNGPAKLLNKQGNMCCLGFAANQISKKGRDQLLGNCEPSQVYRGKSFLTNTDKYLEVIDNNLSDMAMRINDDRYFTEEEREAELTKLFRDNNIKLVFKN
jgi:hypothetical protein